MTAMHSAFALLFNLIRWARWLLSDSLDFYFQSTLLIGSYFILKIDLFNKLFFPQMDKQGSYCTLHVLCCLLNCSCRHVVVVLSSAKWVHFCLSLVESSTSWEVRRVISDRQGNQELNICFGIHFMTAPIWNSLSFFMLYFQQREDELSWQHNMAIHHAYLRCYY